LQSRFERTGFTDIFCVVVLASAKRRIKLAHPLIAIGFPHRSGDPQSAQPLCMANLKPLG
jgi:hypothetical protein